MQPALAQKHYFNQTPLYELNYGKLLRFFRGVKCAQLQMVRHPQDLRLVATVKEDHRYTSVVDIAVTLHSQSTIALSLTLTVRMYHDAKVAEVVHCDGLDIGILAPEYLYPNKHMYQRDEKRQVNRLLGEWLDFFAHSVGSVVTEPQNTT